MWCSRAWRAAALAGMAAGLLASGAAGQFRFSIAPVAAELTGVEPRAINARGEVGGVYGPSEDQQGFFWKPGAGAALLLQGPPGSGGAVVEDLDDRGVALVHATRGGAFLWSEDGGIVPLPQVGIAGRVQAMNEGGQVVGSRVEDNAYRAYRWDTAGGEAPLPTPEGFAGAWAIGINDAGDAVGTAIAELPAGGITMQGVLWRGDGTMAILGGLGSPPEQAQAYDISSAGQAVGYGLPGRALLWTRGGPPQDLGDHPAREGGTAYHEAIAINGVGHAVGYAEVNDAEDHRAFFWTADEGMMDLNARLDESGAGWVLEAAWDINDADQIVGWGMYQGEPRGFVLTPTAVPEPGAGLVLAAVGFLAWRRRGWTGISRRLCGR